jgi:hypothetical protein
MDTRFIITSCRGHRIGTDHAGAVVDLWEEFRGGQRNNGRRHRAGIGSSAGCAAWDFHPRRSIQRRDPHRWQHRGSVEPAARGETLVLYLTGLGPVQNTPASGDAASLTTLSPTVIKPAVTIGGFDSTVIFSGLAPGFIGLYQINVTVPAAVATGTVDLTVLSNGVTSNTAKIPIR